MKNALSLIKSCLLTLPFCCNLAIASPPPAEVLVSKVTREDIPSTMEFVGQTKGALDAEVRARVDGVLTGMKFEEGKAVKEGQLLYTIDPAPMQAEVAKAMGVLAQAETRLTKAASDAARFKPLAATGAISERQYDASVAEEGAARGEVDAAKASVDSARINLSYTQITAPTSGIIGISKAKVGEYVGRPPNPVVLNTVSNLESIHAQFGVNEKEYLAFARAKREKLDAGQEADKATFELVLADGSVHPDKGELAYIDREINPQTGTLTVEARFPNPHQLIRPGQYAKIRVTLGSRKDALVIPRRALREIQGQFLAFVVNADNTVQQKTVSVGPAIGDLQIVESGLSEGDTIVVDGSQRLKAGMTVTPKLIS